MNSLVADYGDETDTDSSESDLNRDDVETTGQTKPDKKLPAPRFEETGVNNASVFRNMYLEAERTRIAVLEKHVKMVPAVNYLTKINGRDICWMNRKGHCRFGHKCKFAHLSELINDPYVTNEDKTNKNSNNNLNKMKKRPRSSQTLIPGKRVRKTFIKTEMSNLHS